MTDDDDIQEYARPCPNCEYYRKRAQLWRDEAYKQAGHPLPEQDGECKHCTDGCPACDARKLPEQKPFAWYDPTNGMVSTDKDSPLFTPLGQVLPLYTKQEQEPVAYINVEQRKLEWAKYMSWDTPTVVNLPKIPLYTTPPRRTWVELDEEDYIKAYELCDFDKVAAFEFFESKLKEKNT